MNETTERLAWQIADQSWDPDDCDLSWDQHFHDAARTISQWSRPISDRERLHVARIAESALTILNLPIDDCNAIAEDYGRMSGADAYVELGPCAGLSPDRIEADFRRDSGIAHLNGENWPAYEQAYLDAFYELSDEHHDAMAEHWPAW